MPGPAAGCPAPAAGDDVASGNSSPGRWSRAVQVEFCAGDASLAGAERWITCSGIGLALCSPSPWPRRSLPVAAGESSTVLRHPQHVQARDAEESVAADTLPRRPDSGPLRRQAADRGSGQGGDAGDRPDRPHRCRVRDPRIRRLPRAGRGVVSASGQYRLGRRERAVLSRLSIRADRMATSGGANASSGLFGVGRLGV